MSKEQPTEGRNEMTQAQKFMEIIGSAGWTVAQAAEQLGVNWVSIWRYRGQARHDDGEDIYRENRRAPSPQIVELAEFKAEKFKREQSNDNENV